MHRDSFKSQFSELVESFSIRKSRLFAPFFILSLSLLLRTNNSVMALIKHSVVSWKLVIYIYIYKIHLRGFHRINTGI